MTLTSFSESYSLRAGPHPEPSGRKHLEAVSPDRDQKQNALASAALVNKDDSEAASERLVIVKYHVLRFLQSNPALQ